ncbi:MAG: T9SS type A sorting domain-containing protein [Flavobacteriales bacterium]
MKNKILSISIDSQIRMQKKMINLSGLLLIIGMLIFSLQAKAYRDVNPGLISIPLQIKATDHQLHEISEIHLNLQLENIPQVMSISINELYKKDEQDSDVKFTYKSDGKIDVDIIIRVTGTLSTTYPLGDFKDPRILNLSTIEVITVDNISGVTQSEPNVLAFRASINGVQITDDQTNASQASPIISLLPAIYKGEAENIKLNATELAHLTQVYPNPSADGNIRIKTTIEGLNIEQIQVYNSLGSMVMQQDLRNASAQELTLQLNPVKGIYFIRVLTPYGETTKKLIISK